MKPSQCLTFVRKDILSKLVVAKSIRKYLCRKKGRRKERKGGWEGEGRREERKGERKKKKEREEGRNK